MVLNSIKVVHWLVIIVEHYILNVLYSTFVKSKPGMCPRNNVKEPVFGVCAELCSRDSDCPNDQKCCSNGCGHQCMFLSRVCVTEKPGVCPRYNVIGICVVRENNCFNDGECPNDQKCCSYGCGRQCMDPYRGIYIILIFGSIFLFLF
uniref:WAP domain-containing protein n=1 Tax=Cyprinus carpio TaxID=7962 RepID=A0A8C2EF27_CYPCA